MTSQSTESFSPNQMQNKRSFNESAKEHEDSKKSETSSNNPSKFL